jgi:hypothetical protein
MTAIPSTRPTVRMPRSVRAAQVLLLLPLGLVQLVAAVTFTIVLRPTAPGDLAVAAWAIAMSSACTITALRFGRPGTGAFRIALGLLVAEAAFSVVKLTVYREPESLVFLALTVTAASLLLLPAARRHFAGAGAVGGPGQVGAAAG